MLFSFHFEPANTNGCKLVTCAWLMRTKCQMTHWWYDKPEGKLGKRARFWHAKYRVACFISPRLWGFFSPFGDPKKRRTLCSSNVLAISADILCFRCDFLKVCIDLRFVWCPPLVSSCLITFFSLHLCLFTAIDNHHASFRCRGSSACKFVDYFPVDPAFVGGSSKQMSALSMFDWILLRSARYVWNSWKSTMSISSLVLADTR